MAVDVFENIVSKKLIGLDIGCGRGACAWFMAKEGGEVTTFDGIPTGLHNVSRIAKEFGVTNKFNLVLGDITSPVKFISETFDILPPFADSSLAFGDIDQDGLDEIITIEEGDIIARNSNQTLVNGFPLKGDFTGIPLIANILSLQDSIPEIICREGENITILSNKGDRLRQLSSFNSVQPLAMVPFWDGKMALIDGSRLFLFDLDMENSYWLNPNSRPSGFPLSTGEHFEPNNLPKWVTIFKHTESGLLRVAHNIGVSK